ncbi:MAG: 4-hydroxythreonine-4-phosphate dehydrogenase PdxA [Bacteroidetes bacterium]|nr:4-hydroxythreonine-4-phosphate dehydrogenase PdxA [Bacteroidota bacterium]
MELEPKSSSYKPLLGITLGDFNGIGPEVIMKSLEDSRVLKLCSVIIYGSSKVLSYYRRLFDLKHFNYNIIRKTEQYNPKKVNVLECWEHNYEMKPGQATPESGKCAYLALKKVTQDLKSGLLNGVVTGSINKSNIQNEEFQFTGHTDYFNFQFDVKESLMLMVSGKLRVGLVTDHLPIKKISENVTTERLSIKLSILINTINRDFGVQKPKIAVLGLNPHAGENGLLGEEENEIISPAIKEMKQQNHLIFGPFPADGFFGNFQHHKFDGILAMYHDQGLIPFKTLAFDTGINYTAGLPIIRTSPDHGTAYNIAGKNVADPSSFLQALLVANDVIKMRKEHHLEITI